MFIRKVKQHKKGKSYSTYRLVESVRTEKGPRQRVLLNLGSNFNLPEDQWKSLCGLISEKISAQTSIIPFTCISLEKYADSIIKNILQKHADSVVASSLSNSSEPCSPSDFVMVDLNSLYHNDVQSIGGEMICMQVIRQLELPQKLKLLRFNDNQIALALGCIVARLLSPGSERSSFFWLKNQSALGELIGFDYHSTSLNRFYDIADLLYSQRNKLEQWLYQQEQKLFSLSDSIILYDLTNTYFEGSGKFNKKAKYGRSKEKRSDALLVTLGLVLDGDGFVKRSDVMPGNISEPGTLSSMLDQLLPGQQTVTRQRVILDAGIATAENLRWLNERGLDYVVVSRNKSNRPADNEFEDLLSTNDGPAKAKLVRNNKTSEWELYVNSPARVQKEGAIKSKFMQSMEKDLKKVQASLKKKNGIKRIDKVHQRLGRIKEKYKRVADLYEITVTPNENGQKVDRISWKINLKKESVKLTGIYCLRTNLQETTAEELWKLYLTLNRVENAFRNMKSTLGLRPVYHQKERRVDAHLFITILAYHILHSIEQRLRKHGTTWSWATIRKILSTHVRLTTVVKDQIGSTIHIRKNGMPNAVQKQIYHQLELPQNLITTKKTVFDKNQNVVT